MIRGTVSIRLRFGTSLLLSPPSHLTSLCTSQLAETAAYRSVSYVDPTGHLQGKFAQVHLQHRAVPHLPPQDDLGKKFLKKLENSVVRQYGNSNAYNPSPGDRLDDDNDEDDDGANYENSSGTGVRREANGGRPPQQHQRGAPTLQTNRPRTGTELYQNQKTSLKHVNRPSMKEQAARQGGPAPNPQLHSPIKTQRASIPPSSDGSESVNTRGRVSGGGGGTGGGFNHLLQPTASSSSRTTRVSLTPGARTISQQAGRGGDDPHARNRSPRRLVWNLFRLRLTCP